MGQTCPPSMRTGTTATRSESPVNIKEPLKAGLSSGVRRLFKRKEMGTLIPLLAIVIITSILNPIFLNLDNIVDLLRNISYTLIVAIGMTYMIISGNLDLSVGSIITLGGMATGFCLVHGVPVALSILMGIIVATAIGFLNGWLVVKLNIPSIIATLGTMYIAKGIVLVVSKGTPYYPFPKSFNAIGQSNLLGVSYSVYIAAILSVIFGYMLEHTTYGRKVMALGGNPEATRVAGVNIGKLRFSIYCLIAALAGFVGILMAARLSSSMANAGDGKEMTVAAAAIIGGASIWGGVGSIWGTIIGVAIMEVITNALVILRVSAYWQSIMIGLIMILAVSLDTLQANRPLLRISRRKKP